MRRLILVLAAAAAAVPAMSGNAPETGAMTSCGAFRQVHETAGDRQVLDSAVTKALGAKLDEYAAIIGKEPETVKCGEADFLIESCQDSLVRQFTALRLYGHYISSRLMGDEAVAIHIYDRWFATGKVRMQSELDLMNARIFAEFNRQSLIGRQAQEISMEDLDGRSVTLFGDRLYRDRMSVLFFYDTGCATCKVESILLRNLLDGKDYRIDLYAIYTGQSRADWENFIRDYLVTDSPQTRVTHLWDPDISSGYQMKYGVIQTPRIFLVSEDGTITGRGLDVLSLGKLLDIYSRPYTYGSEKSSAFFDRMFAGYGKDPECREVKDVCDSIASRTLDKGDTLAFRRMAGDLMYWLGSRRGEGIKCGLEYLLGRYITGMPELWTNPGDSLAILSYGSILKDLLGKAGTGKRLPGIEVPGIVKTHSGEKEKTVRLDRLRNTTVIFHTRGCGICEAELAAADSVARSDRKARFFIVDMDYVLDISPETAYRLFDEVDLSVLPYITRTDRKGLVCRRYISCVGKGPSAEDEQSLSVLPAP